MYYLTLQSALKFFPCYITKLSIGLNCQVNCSNYWTKSNFSSEQWVELDASFCLLCCCCLMLLDAVAWCCWALSFVLLLDAVALWCCFLLLYSASAFWYCFWPLHSPLTFCYYQSISLLLSPVAVLGAFGHCVLSLHSPAAFWCCYLVCSSLCHSPLPSLYWHSALWVT